MSLDVDLQSLISLAPPLLFIAGVALLVIGDRCLNAAVGLAGFAIGWTACGAALDVPAIREWMPERPAYVFLGCLLVGLLAAAVARRNAVIRRWLELAGTIVTCLLLYRVIIALFGPVAGWGLIVLAVSSALLSRSALIGCVAGTLFVAGAHPIPAAHATAVLGVSVLIACVRFGRLAGVPIPMRSVRRQGFSIEQRPDSDQMEAVLVYESARDAFRAHSKWTARGREARLFEGLPGLVSLRLPRMEAVTMQRLSTAMSLVTTMPRMMADAATPMRLNVPIYADTGAPPITPERIAERLRTGRQGRKLSGRGSRGEGAVVAVIDSGFNQRGNGDLADRVIHAQGFVPHEPGHDDRTESQHGSNVLRIIAACAPAAKFVVYKVFDQQGTSTFKQFLEALDAFAQRDDATVANFSGGHAGCRGADRCISCHAVNRVSKPFVASAGNAGPGGLSCPGAASHSVGVAAGDANSPSRIAPFSSRGPSVAPGVNPKPNVTAVGVNVQLKDHSGRLRGMNGTSFSAPQVAAGIAVVESYSRKRDKVMTPRELVRCVCESADPAGIAPSDRHADAMGKGMVDFARACQVAAPARLWPIRDYRRIFRDLPRAAAVLLLVLLPTSLGAVWWCGFDHVGTHKPTGHPGDVTMVGRIHEGTDARLILDDGTGWIEVNWVSGRPSRIDGCVVVLRGKTDGAGRRVLADWHWALWRPGHSAARLPDYQATASRGLITSSTLGEWFGVVRRGIPNCRLLPAERQDGVGGRDG